MYQNLCVCLVAYEKKQQNRAMWLQCLWNVKSLDVAFIELFWSYIPQQAIVALLFNCYPLLWVLYLYFICELPFYVLLFVPLNYPSETNNFCIISIHLKSCFCALVQYSLPF